MCFGHITHKLLTHISNYCSRQKWVLKCSLSLWCSHIQTLLYSATDGKTDHNVIILHVANGHNNNHKNILVNEQT